VSVRVTVEFLVHGAVDAEAVEEAMRAHDGVARDELGNPIWFALQDAGIDVPDVETVSVEYEVYP
jgi:hypothetical protein